MLRKRVQRLPRPGQAIGWLPLTATAMLMSACGGGGSDATSTPTPGAITLTAGADSSTLPWNKPVRLSVLANDSASRGALSLASVTVPGHGTAKVLGSEIEYTPGAGYIGSDSFSYTVRADDGTTATATVSLKVQASITLKGVAADAPLAGATVTALVGGQPFTATTDAQGAYSLVLLSDSLANDVQLTAVGAGTQSKVRLQSNLGDLATLVKLADKDGVLAPAQSAATLISHYSTALDALLTEANGSKTPTSASQITALSRQVSSDRLLDVATAIKLVADKGTPLPEGVADTAALARGTAASVDTFLARSDSRLLASARAEVLSASGLSAGGSFAPTEPVKLVVFQAQLGNAAQPLQLEFQPGGDVRVLSKGFGTAARWVASAGEITVTLNEVYSSTRAVTETDPATGLPATVTLRREVRAFKLRQVAGTPDAGSLLLSTLARETVTSGPGTGTVRSDDWDTAVLSKSANVAVLPALLPSSFQVGKRYAGMIASDDGSGADILELTGTDSARLLRTGTVFSWQVGEGRFILKSGPLERSYAELRSDESLAMKYLLAVDTQDGATRRAREEVGVAVDSGAVMAADASLFKRWQSAFSSDGQFEISAGGTGKQLSLVAGAQSSQPISWTLTASGSLRIVNGTAVREWILLQRRDARLVVLEGQGTASRISSWRINTYTDPAGTSSSGPGSSTANTLVVSGGETYPLRVKLMLIGSGQVLSGEYEFHKLDGTMTPCTYSPDTASTCHGANGALGAITQGGALSKAGVAGTVSLESGADEYGYSFKGSVTGTTWSGTWTKVSTAASGFTGSGTFSVDLVITP